MKIDADVLVDVGCLNCYWFLNQTLVGYQSLTTQGWARVPGGIRELLSNSDRWFWNCI